MKLTNYTKYQSEKMILRDYLAAERTILASERTYLAYVRTSITTLIAGVTFIQFFNSIAMEILGAAFIVGSVGFFVYGTIRQKNSLNVMLNLKDEETNSVEDSKISYSSIN